MSILHSRFAEVRRNYQEDSTDGGFIIPQEHAHPNIDAKNRIGVFHNGQIANCEDLIRELKDNGVEVEKNLTDSQLVTTLISAELDKTNSLKSAIKNVVEQKLLGTYRLAIIEMANPDSVFFVKNSGDFALAQSKANDEILISSDLKLFEQQTLKSGFTHI